MIVHTLGPESTDSATAAATYLATHTGERVLHSSFEAILTALDTYAGDYLLIPAAFKSVQHPEFNWSELNYVNWEQLTIVDVFHQPLLPMVLLENTAYENNIARIHAATEGLLKKYLRAHQLDNAWGPSVLFAKSKPAAYADFVTQQERFTIASEASVTPSDTTIVRQRLCPSMVWVVYQIH